MGVTVRQKVRGTGNPWYVFIHQNGIIRSISAGDKRTAEIAAVVARKELALGKLNLETQKRIPMFKDYADHYLNGYAKVAIKPNTWKSYETIIRLHLMPVWINRRLDEIKRADVKQLILQKQLSGLAPATVENIKALVSGIFTHAYEEEILQANPALKLGRFIHKDDRRKHLNPLSKENVSHFLATAQREFPDSYPLLLCAFRTGMRMGELMGLAWEDVDFESNRIEVRRSYSHDNYTTPKSHKSRVVDMSDQLRQVLLGHKSALTKEFGGRLPVINLDAKKFKPHSLHLAFPNQNGGTMDGDNLRKRVFYKLIEKSDLPRFRFHDIRHTFASLLLQQGEPVNYVKEQMGHASIQTTVDVYGHIIPGSNRNAVNKLDDEIKPELRLVTNAS